MPRYRANVKLWLGHESREIPEGEEFETTFPKAKLPNGDLVDMRLGDKITMLGETEAEFAAKRLEREAEEQIAKAKEAIRIAQAAEDAAYAARAAAEAEAQAKAEADAKAAAAAAEEAAAAQAAAEAAAANQAASEGEAAPAATPKKRT